MRRRSVGTKICIVNSRTDREKKGWVVTSELCYIYFGTLDIGPKLSVVYF